MEAGEYAVSPSGCDGKYRGCAGQHQYTDSRLDRDDLHQSGHGIHIRPERYSYAMLRESGEFVINLTTEKLAWAADYCGVRSGRDEDKWEKTGLHKEKAAELRYAPLIAESPVNIECRVTEVRELGSHHMFIAEVKAVHADEGCLNKTGRLELNRAGLIAYSHGEYLAAGRTLGTFGFSVKKKKTAAKKKAPGQKRRVRQKKSDTTKAT